MPRTSRTENVRKLCGCAKWKTCAHAWYLDYQRNNVRYRDNLDKLTGHHATSFTEAKDEARRAIVAKLNGRDPKGVLPSDDPTLAQLMTEYQRERPRRDKGQAKHILRIEVPSPHGGMRAFGDWRASAITVDTLKAFRQRRPLVAANRDLGLLRAVCNWAVLQGLLERSPFRIGGVPALRLAREEARTRRGLQPGEHERLLRAADGLLSDHVTMAIETGCRRGEILSLQFHQVRFAPRAEIFIPAHIAKQHRDRRIPISTVLAAVLARRRTDPAGEILPQDAYVFGDAIGRRLAPNNKKWKATCRRAGIVDLHFHDLRREAGSRWMDAGIPLATIQRWLGHANISQTSTYLGASLGADEQDMRAYEEKIGRVRPLTYIDVSDRPNRPGPTSTGNVATEKTQQNTVVH